MPAGVTAMTTLTIRERRDILADLKTAGIETRPSPIADHIEVFVDSLTEPGFKRWADVRFTREAIKDAVTPLRIATKTTGDGWVFTPYRFATDAERTAFLRRLEAENPGRQFRAA
jgi:hypothetical protein